MARVLVVGGAGYIGSHVSKSLAERGHEVAVFDDLSTGFRELARYGEFHLGTILDRAELASMFKSFKPEAVMHFAARAAVGESVENPSLYYDVNVRGSYELLEAVRLRAPEAKFIFSSTCAVYGESEKPLSEKNPLNPVNPYGRTKKIVEDMLADYGRAYDLRYCSLRYFNAAGADRDAEVGEMHDPETHLIPRLLLKLAKEDFGEVFIHGTDYPTPDGTCIRDYIHVEDLASAHILAMEKLLKGGSSAIYNLGSAAGHSVREVIAMVEEVTGQKLKVTEGPRRPGDPPRLVADSGKIHEELGWKPEHDLESIVRSAWRWTKKRLG